MRKPKTMLTILLGIVMVQQVHSHTEFLEMNKMCVDLKELWPFDRKDRRFSFSPLSIHWNPMILVHSSRQNSRPITKWVSTCTITCFTFATVQCNLNQLTDWTICSTQKFELTRLHTSDNTYLHDTSCSHTRKKKKRWNNESRKRVSTIQLIIIHLEKFPSTNCLYNN